MLKENSGVHKQAFDQNFDGEQRKIINCGGTANIPAAFYTKMEISEQNNGLDDIEIRQDLRYNGSEHRNMSCFE